jgi:hypothetical protein
VREIVPKKFSTTNFSLTQTIRLSAAKERETEKQKRHHLHMLSDGKDDKLI